MRPLWKRRDPTQALRDKGARGMALILEANLLKVDCSEAQRRAMIAAAWRLSKATFSADPVRALKNYGHGPNAYEIGCLIAFIVAISDDETEKILGTALQAARDRLNELAALYNVSLPDVLRGADHG